MSVICKCIEAALRIRLLKPNQPVLTDRLAAQLELDQGSNSRVFLQLPPHHFFLFLISFWRSTFSWTSFCTSRSPFPSCGIICLHLFLPAPLFSCPVTAVCCHYHPALTTSRLLSAVSQRLTRQLDEHYCPIIKVRLKVLWSGPRYTAQSKKSLQLKCWRLRVSEPHYCNQTDMKQLTVASETHSLQFWHLEAAKVCILELSWSYTLTFLSVY